MQVSYRRGLTVFEDDMSRYTDRGQPMMTHNIKYV